jgi:cytochrome c553
MLKQTTVIGSIMITLFGATPTTSVAADVAAGKAKASVTCAMCHGPLGQSMQPNVPNLSGQPEIYTIEQLRNYRSGKRAHEVMSLMAKPLTDSEIDNLAGWYGSLKVDVSEK